MGFAAIVTSVLVTLLASIAIQVYVLPHYAPEFAPAAIVGTKVTDLSQCPPPPQCTGDQVGEDGEILAAIPKVDPNKPVKKISSLGEYSVTLWIRRAERRPSITMTNFTIVTHATLDRLPHLTRWCKSWRGPISVSVFIKPGQVAEEIIKQMFDEADECIRRHVDMHMVERIKTGDEDESDMFTHYPFNVQRNAALDGATGNMVFLLDIDFAMYPANDARERKIQLNFAKLRSENSAIFGDVSKTLYVIPATETVTSEVTAPKTHEELKKMLENHEVCAFYGHYCTRCHLPTNLNRFVAATEPYEAQYTDGYEPYVVANRRTLPRYDEKFIGRGWDKMSFFYELNAQGRRFVVLPGVFLVHTGRGDQPKGSQYTEEYMNRQKENSMLMHNFKAEMKSKYGYTNPGEAPEDSYERPENATDWSVISSSVGQPYACVSKLRGPDLTKDEVASLEAALSYACNAIDCTPLRAGGVRYWPRNIVFQADWAFDRYFHEAVSRGEPPASACNFSGIAKRVACTTECYGCIARPTASKQRISDAITWLCGPKVLENCDGILGMMPEANRTTHQKAGVLFSFYYNVMRCVHHDADGACFFNGAGMRAPCSRIPD